MVKTPRTRHSKSRREPLTIELDPTDVARVADAEQASTAPEPEGAESYETTGIVVPTDAELAAQPPADDAQASPSESGLATETGTATQPEQEYQPAEALQERAADSRNETESAEAEPEHPAPQAPVPPPPAPPRSDGFSRVAAGLIGAVIALAGAAGLQYAGVLGTPGATTGPAPASADIESLRQEIAALKGAGGADELAARIDGMAAGLDALKADVAALRDAGSAATGVDGTALQALDGRIKEIEAGVAALGQNTAPDTAALTALGDRVAAIESQTKSETDAVAQADQRIAGIEQTITTLTGRVDAQAQQPKIALAIATAALKAAVDRGAPFAAELDAFAAIAPDAPGIQNLKAFADKGVPTREALLSGVEPAAAAMIAASRPADPNAGFFDRLLQSAESLVTVKPIGAVEGSGVPEIVARMQVALTAGDLGKALAEFDTLPDAAKAAAGTFAEQLKARRDAEQLVDQAIAGAMKA